MTAIPNFKVLVQCRTFNHHSYIEDTMNGFCMQKTDFPFVCVIVDDASTDGEQDVIRKYLDSNFSLEDESSTIREDTEDYTGIIARHKENANCYFCAIFLKYNHYRIGIGKQKYFGRFEDESTYVALCEGDDYWTSPDKLQLQKDYLDNNPDCTMCCSDAHVLCGDKEYDWHRYDSDSDITTHMMIVGTGGYVATCTLLYRAKFLEGFPDFCRFCSVGDYPLQIWMSIKGRVRYMSAKLGAYRYMAPGSWSSDNASGDDDRKIRQSGDVIKFLQSFDAYTGGKYQESFQKAIKNKIVETILQSADKRRAYNYFRKDIQRLSSVNILKLLVSLTPLKK